MTDEPTRDFGLLVPQQRQVLAEIGSMRDDIAVPTAIAMRQDVTLAEIRAMHGQHARQHARLGNRVRDLEART